MKNVLYKKYWQAGFASRLYDLLAPEAYLDSLRRAVDLAPAGAGKVWLDAGCGSGLASRLLRDRLRGGDRYFGADRLMSGVGALRAKIKALGMEKAALAFQADVREPLPMKESSVDIVLAHFSINTVGDARSRARVLENFRHVLKPGGTLIVVCPSREYSAENIIRESLAAVRRRRGTARYWIKKWLVYPLTLRLGLRFVEGQLETDVWHAYAPEELRAEIRARGFEIKSDETTYANSAHLVAAIHR